MGKLIGEFIGFTIVFTLYSTNGDAGAGSAFLIIAILTFVVGLFVSCLMVKEKKISVVYMIDPLGVHQIVKEELAVLKFFFAKFLNLLFHSINTNSTFERLLVW